jgi:Protein of unknown function (DUF4242)
MNPIKTLLVAALSLLLASSALADKQPKPEALPAGQHMYVIEREMPGVGKLTPEELKAASQKSCSVLRNLGPQITWLHSYVTGDKLYCVYLAPNEEMVREHAKEGGFPANKVSEVKTIIDPSTAGS